MRLSEHLEVRVDDTPGSRRNRVDAPQQLLVRSQGTNLWCFHVPEPKHVVFLQVCKTTTPGAYTSSHGAERCSWHLGTCLPSGVLDEAGYIATHQNQIQALSLITDGTCVDADVGLDGLAKLNQLRHVSWDGLYEARALPPLAQCLDRNRNHLRSLRLGFCELYDCHENCQAMSSVLLDRLQQGLPKGAVKFPLLDALSLSNAAFLAKKELALTVLNIANLRSLTLRDCSFQLEFLESLATLRPGVRLTHFGICFDEFREPDLLLDTHPVLDFLVSFAGLESLHVLISNSFRPGDWFARPVEHHRASLKRLVHHERSLMPLDGRAIFEETRDIPTSWISQIDHALDSSVVRALGLCLSPSVAVSPHRHSQIMIWNR